MSIRLVCEPGKTVSWKDFRNYPVRSIALDGYCNSRPCASASGLRVNIDHHRGVDRFATRSSCDQALILVKMGLYKRFQVDDVPDATIYVNDCDQDVALATYILMHPEHADRPRLKLLVRVEDLLDMSAGLYPMKNNRKSRVMKQLAWITHPYTKLRAEGQLDGLTAEQMKDVILQMHRRIHKALFGSVPEFKLDTGFEAESRGSWHLVREVGSQARIGMGEAGITAFLTMLSERGGRHRYVLGRLSHFIPFPIPQICAALNAAEGIAKGKKDRWGGSENCGGSPRRRGSTLSPEQVAAVIDETIAEVLRRAHQNT